MAINLTINGNSYSFPEPDDTDWGQNVTDWATAVTGGMLQKAGGTFTLTAELDFGATYGLKSAYYKTRSSNIASAGEFRLARTDTVTYRNAANDGDLELGVNASDQLTFDGSSIVPTVVTVSDTTTIDLTLTGTALSADVKSDSITNTQINSSAAIAYSKLDLSDSIVNADINSSAAIAYSKLDLTGGVVNADVDASAAIAYSKLNLTGSIVNADVDASAAIAQSKLDLSITNSEVDASAAIAYSKLDLSGSIVNADIDASAAIVYSKLDLSGSIVNADVDASAAIAQSKLSLAITDSEVAAGAAIAYDKMEPLTANRVLTSNGSGDLAVSSQVSVSELNYLNGVTANLQTQLDNRLELAGGTMTGDLTLAGDPDSALKAATKQYVDNAVQGLKAKQSVRVATTANGTFASAFDNGSTVDGVSLSTGDRILIKNQTDETQNGIYEVQASGAPSRTADADTWDELVAAFVFVESGTANPDTGWVCTTNPGGTLGVNDVTFVQFSSAGIVTTDDEGIIKTGNELSLDLDGSTLSKSGSGIKVADGGIANTQIDASAAIAQSKLALSITNSEVDAGAAIAYSKLALSNSIDNADINSSAAIAQSKLALDITDSEVNASAAIAQSKLALDITNSEINASAAIAYSKLDLTGNIVNADINASAAIAQSKIALDITNSEINAAAAIAFSKMENLTASRALVSDGSGDVSVSAVTATELGYLDGVTSNIQTQINGALTNPMDAVGQVIYGGASGVATKLAAGTTGQVLTSSGAGAPTWETPSGSISVVAISSNVTLTNNSVNLVDTSSARSLTLPSPVSGARITVKDADGTANTNNITIVRDGSENIEGVAASRILQTNWGCWTFFSDGTDWFIING